MTLREYWDSILAEPIPSEFAALLAKLDEPPRPGGEGGNGGSILGTDHRFSQNPRQPLRAS
jgi:hypothetical protein